MRINKKAAAVAVAAVTLAGSGVAYAWWTSNGSGAGTASTGNAQGASNVTLVGTAPSMVPGDGAHPVSLVVTNPNTYSVSLTGRHVVLDTVSCGTTLVQDASLPASTGVFAGMAVPSRADWFSLPATQIASITITPPHAGGGGIGDPVATSLGTTGVTLALADDATNSQDVCQGKSLAFTFHVVA